MILIGTIAIERDWGNAGLAVQPLGKNPRMSARVATTVFGHVFPPLAALITAPILARSLGVDGRGEVAAATGPLLLVVTIATLGIPEAVTYTVARKATGVVRILIRAISIVALSGSIATIALYLLSNWLSGGSATVRSLILLAALAVVPTLAISVLRGMSAGRQNWNAIAFERGTVAFSRVAIISLLAHEGQLTPFTATMTIALTPFAGAVAYLFVLRKEQRLSIGEVQREEAPPLLGFGMRVWFGSMAGILLMRLDQALLNPLAGSYQLGIYAVAVAVSEVPLVVNSAVRDVIFATEAGGHSDRRLTSAARISAAMCCAVAAVLAIFAPVGVPLLFGAEFSEAVVPTLILLLAVAVGPAGSIAGAGLSGRGRPGLRSTSLIVAAMLNIVILILLAPVLGAIGAALSTLAGNLVSSHLNIVFITRMTGIRYVEFFGVRRSDQKFLAQELRHLMSVLSSTGKKSFRCRCFTKRRLPKEQL